MKVEKNVHVINDRFKNIARFPKIPDLAMPKWYVNVLKGLSILQEAHLAISRTEIF